MQPPDLSRLLLPIQDWDHIQGPDEALHTLVEYGDYECPACGRLYQFLEGLRRERPAQLRLAFRHYPLSGVHKQAQGAAEAAEAAGAQGKFWQMHSALFEHQGSLGSKDLIAYAEQLRLDVDRFKKELKAKTYSERVRENFRAGVQNGVFGTPGLFLNGVRHNGAIDEAALRVSLL
jgi:protein-disulfide isomerase